MNAQLFAFIGVAALLTITPGADMALVTRVALTRGRPTALKTIAGICSGLMVHATASAVGLSAILLRSARAFDTVKLIGAVYLLFLGVQAVRESRRSDEELARHLEAPATRGIAVLNHPYAMGLLSNVLNPKVALFYLTFLPQFLSPGDPILAKSLLLAGIHATLGVIWLVAYATLIVRLRATFTRPTFRRWMERTVGAVLIGFGARLAWVQR
ncbi:MAG TPA: LysE family translocator [Candidatus Dormibacteraeota bacterium]|jgi:threonine/homoserine/homoserine lactone efflux protein|nr:LysE family translocator [Candidatus Dormibacteraeota bacterium]